MKKITISFVLLIVLSLTVFAEEGTINTGGKSCPQNQNCLVHPDNTQSDPDDPIISIIKELLILIF